MFILHAHFLLLLQTHSCQLGRFTAYPTRKERVGQRESFQEARRTGLKLAWVEVRKCWAKSLGSIKRFSYMHINVLTQIATMPISVPPPPIQQSILAWWVPQSSEPVGVGVGVGDGMGAANKRSQGCSGGRERFGSV